MTLRANGVTIEIKGDADVTIEGDRVTVRTRWKPPKPPLPRPYEDAWIQPLHESTHHPMENWRTLIPAELAWCGIDLAAGPDRTVWTDHPPVLT